VPHTAFCIFVIAWTCRAIGVRARDYVSAAVMKPVAAAAVGAGAWILFAWAAPATTWIGLFADSLAGLLPYTVVALAFDGQPLSQRLLRVLKSVRIVRITMRTDKWLHSRPPSRAAG
jgi:hypothetical protein